MNHTCAQTVQPFQQMKNLNNHQVAMGCLQPHRLCAHQNDQVWSQYLAPTLDVTLGSDYQHQEFLQSKDERHTHVYLIQEVTLQDLPLAI